MSLFNLFRNRTQATKDVHKAQTVDFIENHKSSTEVLDVARNSYIKAVLTKSHKEGNSETLLFTYIPSKKKDIIREGDYIEHGNKKYITMLEYDHALKEDYLKYNLLACNTNIKVDDINQPAAYFGSLRSYIGRKNDSESNFTMELDNSKPVVITKTIKGLDVGTRFIAAGEAFKVISVDKITIKGVSALSVDKDSIYTDIDQGDVAITPSNPDNSVGLGQYKKGQIVTIATSEGYFAAQPSVTIISKSLNEVEFQLPYDINEIKIETKNTEGGVISTIKEVV